MADGTTASEGSNNTLNDIIGLYQALQGFTPLITGLVGGFGNDYSMPTNPSVLQKMVVQSLVNPNQPIKVSMADLLNPNLLGIQPPKSFGGKSLPTALAASSALPAAAKGIASLGDLLGLFGKADAAGSAASSPASSAGPGGPGVAGAVGLGQPVVSAGDIPQVDLTGAGFPGVTMDAFPATTPVDVSPYSSWQIDTTQDPYALWSS